MTASLCSPCHYVFRAYHNKEFERNLIHLHTAGFCLSLSECSVLFLTVKVHHKQPQHVMDFSLFLFALYLLWNNFLIYEMTTIHVNNTTKKTPCQPKSVHSLGMLIAENVTLPQWRDQTLNAV
jgi:predicted membrane channel-forming protein YqfA (hemolysin III family)